MRIGYLGGSFDPVHCGHIALAEAARSGAGLDEVVFVVAGTPPHKRDRSIAPAADRVEMVRLALTDRTGLRMDDRETKMSGLSYTVETIRALRAEHPNDALFWIIGADTLPELPTWREIDELLDLVGFVSARRPGFDITSALTLLRERFGDAVADRLAGGVVAMSPVPISSTEIRARARRGEDIEGLVPPVVADYIRETGLYR